MYLFKIGKFAYLQKNALIKAINPSNIIRNYLKKYIICNLISYLCYFALVN